MYSHFLSKILKLISPPYCVGCKKTGKLICNNCLEYIYFYGVNLPLAQNVAYLDQLFCLAKLRSPLSDLIKIYKYSMIKSANIFIADLIFNHICLPHVDLLTHIPTHKKKLNIRGYDHLAFICKPLSKKLNINYYPLLFKNQTSTPQAKIKNKQKRISNLKNNFCMNPQYKSIIKGKTILLLDDIYTTGATLDLGAKILKQNQAHKVIGLTLAHGS